MDVVFVIWFRGHKNQIWHHWLYCTFFSLLPSYQNTSWIGLREGLNQKKKCVSHFLSGTPPPYFHLRWYPIPLQNVLFFVDLNELEQVKGSTCKNLHIYMKALRQQMEHWPWCIRLDLSSFQFLFPSILWSKDI